MKEDYLLRKWLSEDITEEEIKRFKTSENFALYKTIIENARHFKSPEFYSGDNYSQLRSRISERTSVQKRRITPWAYRIAGIFILGVALYFSFLYDMTTSYTTGIGVKNKIELPDDSYVVLNASSEVQFSKRRWKSERKITLEGEAFFDVSKGNTFEVSTPQGTITVLGTEFNVKQRNSNLEVSCFEGSVKVTSGTFSEILSAGDKLQINNNVTRLGKITVPSPMWQENVSTFDEIPFSEVLDELQRHYKIDVECNQKEIMDALFTGGFTHDNLEDAVRSLAQPLNLKYQITDQHKVILNTRD